MRVEGKIRYIFEFYIKGHKVALLKHIKEHKWEDGSWYIQIDQTLLLYKKILFLVGS